MQSLGLDVSVAVGGLCRHSALLKVSLYTLHATPFYALALAYLLL